MKNLIYEYIQQHNGTSFVELSREIPGFKGSLAWGMAEKNTWFWHTLSEAAIDAMTELLDEGKIKMTATQPLIYMIDGQLPGMPVAKSTSRNYKSERWLPVLFSDISLKTKLKNLWPEDRKDFRNEPTHPPTT